MRTTPILIAAFAACLLGPSGASAVTLPDNRAYELVSPPDKNGVTIAPTISTSDGDTVDWVSFGGCCGTTTGGEELFQSTRGSSGWTTKGLNPVPSRNLEGLFEIQTPVYYSQDLSKTIYATVEAYDPADHDFGTLNLYLDDGSGPPVWLSRGPLTEATPHNSTFDAATPDAKVVAFSTEEQLTPDATGLNTSPEPAPEYLYVRDVASGSTKLVNVTNADTIVDPAGAALGNGVTLGGPGGFFGGITPPNEEGTTTNAVSSDGSKVFFESPPFNKNSPESPPSHLYMRDLTDGTTTALDNPASTGFARYEGASQDGSLVFFTSTEGLAGDPNTDLELYEFNTTTHAIGPAPAMSAIALSAGDPGEAPVDGQLLGASAIANDGSHVYFVAEGVLTANPNGLHESATAGTPNLYVVDTATGRTGFVAPLAARDATEGNGRPGPLTVEPDVSREAIPTPDGDVLAFASSANLTGQNPPGPSTTLTSESSEYTETLTLESTNGFAAGRIIEVGSGSNAETVEIKSILNGSEIELNEELRPSYPAGTTVTELVYPELYRYSATDGSLVCLSCVAPGVEPVGTAFLTGGGGTYQPPGESATMSADGSRIFFMSQDQLVPEDEDHGGIDVYEWENGQIHLISDGRSTRGSFLFGTTPSGNDVYFTTASQLSPQDTDGSLDTYDARVNGGFGSSLAPGGCTETGCRGSGTSVPVPSVPASSTLINQEEPLTPPPGRPAFTVAKITAAAREGFAKRGRITLTVSASTKGRVTARALARLHGKTRVAASTTTTISPGSAALTLRLSTSARAALAHHGKLALKIELRYSASGQVRILHLTLTRAPAHRRPHARASGQSAGLSTHGALRLKLRLPFRLPATNRPGLLP